ncbi:MAG: hypothetical protein HFH47_01315 [Bacilli bacterium]|nr:hypothetical protein [Bacilli bacterium]
MKHYKFHISTIILLGLLALCLLYRTEIVTFVMGNITEYTKVNKPEENNYTKNFDFEFVQNTDNFHVKNKQEILNVIYTILNSGKDSYTFYCSKDYSDCSKDLKEISENQILLSVINNMVSPYNSYQKLYVTTNTYGKVTITLDKLYSKEDIQNINNKIEQIKAQIINDKMTDEEKIKAFHDYIINLSVYDEERATQIESGNNNNENSNSHKASGPLLEGKALCSGYSDAMKLFLDDLGIKNYKISNSNHIWNLIYINGKWLHLDLTWDDPVTSDKSNMLLHKFFLITTDQLLKLDNTNHNFNREYYLELK